ncbi:MAG: agmatinase [Bdellovibrionota bacterium]
MTPKFLDNGQTAFENANIIVAPIPFEGAISYMPGAAKGPRAILDASSQVELFDFEHQIDLSTAKIHTVDEPVLTDYESVRNYVSSVVERVKTPQQFYLGVGGDHTVTIPAIETLAKRYPKLGIVQIDAHADLRNELHGNPYSHACIMRRNAEKVGPRNILSIGIRAVSEEERDYIEKEKVNTIPGNFALHEDLTARVRELLLLLPEHVFFTIDLDGLDPSIMAHVGTPVPGGLSWHQTLSVAREVFRTKKVVGCDVVEIASGAGTERSDFAAALLCQKLAALWVRQNNS